jgi:hypothetical protein
MALKKKYMFEQLQQSSLPGNLLTFRTRDIISEAACLPPSRTSSISSSSSSKCSLLSSGYTRPIVSTACIGCHVSLPVTPPPHYHSRTTAEPVAIPRSVQLPHFSLKPRPPEVALAAVDIARSRRWVDAEDERAAQGMFLHLTSCCISMLTVSIARKN